MCVIILAVEFQVTVIQIMYYPPSRYDFSF